jgi:hypothetical protein
LTDTLVKRSADGLVEWSKTFESSGDNLAKGSGQIAVANDGGVFVTREVGAPDWSNKKIMLEKYNSDGSVAFSREVSPAQVYTNNTRVTDLKVDAEGSLYASLTFQNTYGDNGPVKADSVAQIVKFNAQGTELWRRSIESDQEDYSGELAIGKSGEIYMVGTTKGVLPGTDGSGGVGGPDSFVARFEKDGTRAWLKQFGENNNTGSSVAVDSTGAVYVSGYSSGGTSFAGQAYSSGKNSAGTLTKFSTSGDRLWDRTYDAEIWYADQQPSFVATSSDGGIFINTSDEKTGSLIRFGSDGTRQYKTTYQTGGTAELNPIRAKSIAIGADRSVYLGVKTGIWNGEERDQTRLLKFSADSGGGTQPPIIPTSSSSSTSSTTQMSQVIKRVNPLNYQTMNLTSDEGVTNAAAYVDAVLSDIDTRMKDVSAGITTATGVASYAMANRTQKAQQTSVAQPVISSSSSGGSVYVPTVGSSRGSSKRQSSLVQQLINSRRRYIA